jgi:hypothetical protein
MTVYPKLVQSKDIFANQTSKLDKLGNVIGFTSINGNLDVNSLGIVPFTAVGPNFASASCAKRLIVQLAVADVCKKGGEANLWIPSVTPHFPDGTVDGVGEPPQLVINRDMTKNPFQPSSNCGKGYDVTVTPSKADVDAHLPIPNYLP